MARGAVANARQAAGEIGLAVAERTLLAPRAGLDDLAPSEHGMLSRLDTSEAMRLLKSSSIGRLAYIARAGAPDIVPVNYVVDGDEIVIASGPGPKLQAADRGELVAFEVDEVDQGTHMGWSVVAVGRARRSSGAQAVPDGPRPQPWARGPRRNMIRIRPLRIEARRLH